MTLHRKILVVIGLTIVGLIVALNAASQFIVMGSFSEQENLDTRQDVERVRSALEDNLSSLEGTTRDWSIWDDTYAFIDDMNDNYYQSNLSNNAPMASNRLNLMLYINSSGRTVFVKAYDYRKDVSMAVPTSLQQHVAAGSALLKHPNAGSSVKGILSLPEGPMLIAAEPIMQSSSEGAIRGTLIFGRFLDTEEIQRFSKTTLFSLTAYQVDDKLMPGDFKDALATLSEQSPILVHPLTSDSIAGYTVFSDVYGKPAVVLRAAMPRGVYARGQDTVNYYMLALLAVGLLFGVLVLVLLERLVLHRLWRLNAKVSSIGASSDLSTRVPVQGSDELSSLANSINGMLAALERSDNEQKESEARYRAVVEQSSEAIFLVDAYNGRILEANAASQVLLGYGPEEILELSLDDIVVPDGEDDDNQRNPVTGKLHMAGERRYRRKDGSVVFVESSDNLINYGGREVLCAVVHDITDRKRAEEILRELAMRDGLTGLYNRREMQRILREEVERYQRYGKQVALIMADIDYFKSVNDTYGHQIGDDVLRWVAQMFREMARSVDKVARYGGEEIALILPESTADDAFAIAERVRTAIAALPFTFTQTENDEEKPVLIPITISLGIASLPDDADSEQSLIEAADQALYKAKRRGRNCTVRCSKRKTLVGASY